LDGGLAAWVACGCPVETAFSAVAPGDFRARPGGMPLVGAEAAAQLAKRGILIDARAPARFRGEEEPVDRVAGHIPGAVNIPTSGNVEESGRFRDPHTLRAAFERAGVRERLAVGVYCGSGVTASHELLALELAGYDAALYAGSWSDWITDPRRPVATGA
jgi:thiosulfate/3-mercaptopyruvate sulfurtransferase